MRRSRLAVGLVVGLVGAASPGAARADDRAADVSATAAALFDRGLAAMQESDYARGCPLIAESARLDPRPGALFTAAECELAWGKLGSADVHYQDFLARYALLAPEQKAGQEARASIATRKRAELARRIPKLVVEMAPGAPVGSTRIARDGVELGPAALGVPLPVDPGEHEVTCTASDGRATVKKVTVPESTTVRVEVEPPAAAPVAPPPPPPEPGTPASRTLGVVSLGLGVVGVGVGSIFGVRAMNGASTVSDHCVGTRCDHEGKVAADRAKTDALVSTIAFAAGGLFVLGGGALLLFGSSSTPRNAHRPPLFQVGAATDGSSGVLVARGGF